MPSIRTTFWRDRAPRPTLTRDGGTPVAFATSRHSAAFAAPSTGGAVTWAAKAPSAPATSRSRAARGVRRMVSSASTAPMLSGAGGGRRARGRPGREQRLELIGAHRLREEVALGAVAAEVAQRLELVVGLDALGDRPEAEAGGDVDDGAHDRRVVRLLAETVDERAVDLDRVDRHALQARQRRVAGAEVVEQDADAERAERLERRAGRGDVLEQHALGDLEAEAAGLEAAARERALHLGEELRAGELAARDVDGDAEVGGVREALAPGGDLGGRLLEHPLAERCDEAGLLGQADELGRCDDAVAGAIPADERLDADQALVGDVEDRLVVDAELLALDGAAQVALGAQPDERVLAHLLVEELVAPAAALLRAVHRGVGLAQHRLGALRPRRDRDPDARRHEDLAAGLQRDRPLPRVGDAPRDGDRLALGRDLAADDELVAAEARDGVRAADHLLEAGAEGDEQVVAGLVAERVVDRLELVDVEQEDRDERAGALGAGERVLDAVVEERAVREAGGGGRAGGGRPRAGGGGRGGRGWGGGWGRRAATGGACAPRCPRGRARRRAGRPSTAARGRPRR